ncbi:hypothetical protein E4U32_004552 [Claviceps aff. humidiphila group G2b]|nr:hypothetical protein E4U32_004552 [Claviceps aff. humidiphila group G2b]
MASAATRRLYEEQMPPLMSVFDLDADSMADGDTVTLVDLNMVDVDAKVPDLTVSSRPISLQQNTLQPDCTHRHHDSTSTHMSGSTDSSPTTTLSTTGSSPLSVPSPSSSPGSPVHLIPLSDYPTASFISRSNTSVLGSNMLSIPETRTLERPVTSPAARNRRNMKGLSILPPLSITTASKNAATDSSSPLFIKPTIPTMKRKPSQLSLKTNASDLTNKPSLEVPASPAMTPILQRRALKHSSSSPHMFAAMKTSKFGPPGGMTFPKVLERNESGLSKVLRPARCRPSSKGLEDSIMEEHSPIRTQMANRNEFEPFHDSANNEDQKSPGYPDGPIAIYSDNVYLYLEPTADEASQFDVVINVAREVSNPFDAGGSEAQNQSVSFSGEGCTSDTAMTDASSAIVMEPSQDVSLETPATSKAKRLRTPEYIHIPWDHNTDIAPDLMNLCKIIEDRTKNGSRVLIHCQQGASRSASLIIAYGLYKSPDLSVNDAYYAAQAKSRWISPNMKLMYSLQDFQKDLSKQRQPSSLSAYRPRTGRSPTKHRLTLSADAISGSIPTQPNTAPLPGGEETSGATDTHGGTRARKRTSMRSVSPGPASAPLSYSWKDDRMDIDSAVPFSPLSPCFPAAPTSKETEPAQLLPPPLSMPAVSPLPLPSPCAGLLNSQEQGSASTGFQPILDQPESSDRGHGQKCWSLGLRAMERPAAFSSFPLRKSPRMTPAEPQDIRLIGNTIAVGPSYADSAALLSPRAQTMTTNPLHQVSEVAGMRFIESAPTPTEGLFSPREASFPQESFSFFGRMMGSSRPSQFADPRSPPTKGEAPITRSIDDLL